MTNTKDIFSKPINYEGYIRPCGSCKSEVKLHNSLNGGGVSYAMLVCEKCGELLSQEWYMQDEMIAYWNKANF